MRALLLPVALLAMAIVNPTLAQDPPKQGDKPADAKAKAGDKQGTDKAKAGDKKAEAGGWITSYTDALAQAKKEKKLVLADFTGSDWCGWCIRLKDEVFSKPEFQKWAKDNVVLLEVDFPRKTELPKDLKKQNDKLARDFKITGYPTILFLDADGKQVGQMGYQEGGPEKWTKDADKIVAKSKGK